MTQAQEDEIRDLRARLGIIHPENVTPAYHNGQIVTYGGALAWVTGAAIDWDGNVTYNLSKRTDDGGWESVAAEVPESKLADSGLVEHHYDGTIIGLVSQAELDAIHEARKSGAMIGLAGAPAGMTIKAASDAAGAVEG